MTDPLAVDSRGWNPRHYGEMTWWNEPKFACIAVPGVTGRSKILKAASRYDYLGIYGEARWIDLRVKVVYYRWAGPEVAEDWEADRREDYACNDCGCLRELVNDDPFDDGIRFLCPGPAMCRAPRATRLGDFWTEEGDYCPWVPCDKAHPMAVKWWVIWHGGRAQGHARLDGSVEGEFPR